MTTRSTTFSNDPFDCIDEFAVPVKTFQPSNIRNVKPLIQPKPSSGSSSFYTCTSSIVPSSSATNNFDESLSNGKNLIKPSTVSMPTIIKPISSKGKASPTHIIAETKKTAMVHEMASDESFDDDLPSLPMPTMPPPPPPVVDEEEEEEKNSYAIVLFDFESDVVEDLNLRVSFVNMNLCLYQLLIFYQQANEKVYLLRQMNDEWIYGRNKRGCEGIFPISYVDIRVPLKQAEPDSGNASRSASVSPAVESHGVRALYTFIAETDEDLTIKV